MEERVLVLNPVSGSADHADRVREWATDHGFTVRETEEEGDAVRFARNASGADLVAACGGDGTVNEVVRGLREAESLGETTLAVVPAGTGNNFAGNVGVRSLEHAFDVALDGETRDIDLGVARAASTRRPFVNSCVGGLTANASAATSPDEKTSLGVLAYVLQTARALVDADPVTVHIDARGEDPGPDEPATDTGGDDGGETVPDEWHGDAACVLVGNARRFPAEGRTQADVEDGAFDVTVVEEFPKSGLAGEAALVRLLGEGTPHIRRFTAPSLTLTVLDGTTSFSLDGEMVETDQLHAETHGRALSVRVGDDYDPTPGT